VAPLSPQEEKGWSLAAHLLVLVGGFVAPLIIWLVFKGRGPFLEHHAKESLNFQITVMIAMFVAVILMFLLVGFVLVLGPDPVDGRHADPRGGEVEQRGVVPLPTHAPPGEVSAEQPKRPSRSGSPLSDPRLRPELAPGRWRAARECGSLMVSHRPRPP
jgi:hypothetical protein